MADEDDLTQWTPAGAERLRVAGAELAAAVTAHAAAVAAVSGEDGVPELLAAHDRLLPAVLAYADAQLDLTGGDFPFGVLHDVDQDQEVEDLGIDLRDPQPPAVPAPAPELSGVTAVTVLQRHDLQVTDEAAVLAAAGEDDLGSALARLARAGGWSAVGGEPGLRSTARSVLVVGSAVAPGEEPDEDGGELLYSHQDVFPD
ncbi:hypothetical protein KUM42_02085 [Modestobacter sp. L9-4]|uniref:hypothetical protein n=1 Tax=Modestobacter sp. L9-4 TaxID=2851567 RepID=UPI001C76EB6E|nr:hypothetical protein [Modestobacter sp. L9-4]QXG76376.1 hypothetical protein KUM42_02085 [Modestobacter sp. L9-4]